MTQPARNVAVFRTTMASKPDRRHLNRLPGRNVAQWLVDELARRGHPGGDVDHEDFGWYAPVTIQDRRYNLLLSPVTGDDGEACHEYVLSLELESLVGQFMAWLAGRSNAEAVAVLEEVLSSADQVHEVKWFARLRDVDV